MIGITILRTLLYIYIYIHMHMKKIQKRIPFNTSVSSPLQHQCFIAQNKQSYEAPWDECKLLAPLRCWTISKFTIHMFGANNGVSKNNHCRPSSLEPRGCQPSHYRPWFVHEEHHWWEDALLSWGCWRGFLSTAVVCGNKQPWATSRWRI